MSPMPIWTSRLQRTSSGGQSKGCGEGRGTLGSSIGGVLRGRVTQRLASACLASPGSTYPSFPGCSVHQGQGVALNPPYTMEQMQVGLALMRASGTLRLRSVRCWMPAPPADVHLDVRSTN